MNELFNNQINLNKDEHKYELKDKPDFEFISVTTFIDTFFEEFDAQRIAQKLVKSSIKYMGMKVEDVLQQWKNSAIHGTKVHEEIEDYLLKNLIYENITESKSLHAISWLNKYKMKSKFKVYTEVVIYSEELKIAGTIDLLLYDTINDYYCLMDWKTSKIIPTKSYKRKMGTHEATQNIEDTKFNHYALQLSLYRYLLETYYNFKINENIIVHLKDHECIGLHSPYMKDNVIDMLKTTKSE